LTGQPEITRDDLKQMVAVTGRPLAGRRQEAQTFL
jgi:hypothetical protein